MFVKKADIDHSRLETSLCLLFVRFFSIICFNQCVNDRDTTEYEDICWYPYHALRLTDSACRPPTGTWYHIMHAQQGQTDVKVVTDRHSGTCGKLR